MKNYITIDGGTTNTRICLVSDRKIIDTVKLNIGARSGIDNSCSLKSEIKQGIIQILNRNFLASTDITKILASGMITSEFGLYNAPHICTPAGIEELNSTMCEVELKDISDISFAFIRGVKNGNGDIERLHENDMMRGEETELIGICEIEHISDDCLFVLPGSHSKLISTDNHGKITAFSTMLTGEMIGALSQNTILKDAVDLSIDHTDDNYLLMGYRYCMEFGINNALFKTRVLKNTIGCSKEEVYSFFIGTVLYNEIQEIVKSSAQCVIVGGRKQIKEATVRILENVTDKNIIMLSDETVECSTSIGMICIYEYNQ